MTKTLDNSQVWTAGRWYTGVGGSFFIFPKTLLYVEYSPASSIGPSLDVWTKDGQDMSIECSFYFQLSQERIFDVYFTFGDAYYDIISAMAKQMLRDVAVQWNTEDFFTNRSSIDDQMTTALAA